MDALDVGMPSLVERFEEVTRRHAERIAVEVPAGANRPARCMTTYAELGRWADGLSAALGSVAGGEEAIVAILLGRETAALYAAQIGVLKAGMAFTCLDPKFPDQHIGRILEDARPVALVSDAAGLERLRRLGSEAQAIDVEVIRASCSARAATGTASHNPSRLAYVIYTSGTTGTPKGVMIEHAGLENLVDSDVEYFGLTTADRVGQVSSPAYDSSLEESWLAFAVGATLVVLDDATVRLGPDLAGWLREERITVLCPPPTLLRSMGCDDPARELPELRLLYVGGEALPRDLAESWAAGRWLENGYGPTECTITVTRGRVRAGQEITIGRPVRGHRVYVLDESLNAMPSGEAGELCISGAGLARGYHGLAQLTAEKFPAHPRLGRLYRTGDLVRQRADGELEYLGRIDGQVKLRGYRVELPAIEAELARCAGVRAAGCRVQGEGAGQLLAAHVVAIDAARPPNLEELRGALRRVLPEYMVPARMAILETLPTSVGGKLDRRALPEIAAAVRRMAAGERFSPAQKRVAGAFSAALKLPVENLHDDFFLDLGGDSLSAVALICELRKSGAGCAATVRDVYEARTVAGLAERLGALSEKVATPGALSAPRPRGRPVLCTLLQSLWMGLLLAAISAPAALLAAHGLPWLFERAGLVDGLLLLPLMGIVGLLAWTPLSIVITCAAKRMLIGRYAAGSAPVWSGLYLRDWIVVSLARLVPWWLLEGTELTSVALRALGARIGRRVHIHRGVDLTGGGWDLLEIGDDVTVAQDAELRTRELNEGQLIFGTVKIGSGATIDVRAGLSPGSRVGANGHLTPLSWLPPDGAIGDGERWDGVPAQRAGDAPARPHLSRGGELSPMMHAVLTLALRCGRLLLAGLAPALLSMVIVAANRTLAARGLDWIDRPTASVGAIAWLIAVTMVSLASWLILQALVLRFGPRVRPGVMSQWSFEAMLVHFKSGAVESAGRWLSGAMFWPWWLRLAGMRIGRGCEISTIIDVVPELVNVGDECFFADGIYFCSPWRHRGTITLGRSELGPRTFLGNHAVVPGGHCWPADFFLGVSTVADVERARADSSWFGHPPMELPRRQVVEADRRLTHAPGLVRYVNRLFWETLRLALPVLPLIGAAVWYGMLRGFEGSMLLQALVVAPLLTLGLLAGLCLAVVALKWALLGRTKPGQHPLWSCWCSRWDFLYVAWGVWARGSFSQLQGSLLLNAVLRLFGVRIGRRVVLGPGFAQVVDPDMLEFGDDATINCHFQAHSFEDRILKLDRVRVGAGATVGDSAVIFYRVNIGEGAQVLPHSVVMKGDTLPTQSRFGGCPAVPDQMRYNDKREVEPAVEQGRGG
jgi:non-ribosomal peptide synthetase-like protein